MEYLLGAGLIYLAYKVFANRHQPNQQSQQILSYPKKVITLVGRTGAGKSSTANALLGFPSFDVGPEHGTTKFIEEKPYKAGYTLRDTPGLLDQDGLFLPLILSSVRDSKIVIYVTTSQLYRQELEFIQYLRTKQVAWDDNTGLSSSRELWLYLNMLDIREKTMTSLDKEKELFEIKGQVSKWIPASRVIVGASSPIIRGKKQPAQISELENLLVTCMKAE